MTLRIGVLGTARIAREFVAGVKPSRRVEVVAVASRDPARAEEFARANGIVRWYGSYELLLADEVVDAVYLPLPNGLHRAWAVAAARAGKHVLCEKPLAAGEAEGREMFEAAAESDTVLMEAYPYQYQQQTQELVRLVRTGAIGEARYLQGAFGFLLSDRKDVRFDPALAGGALRDMGGYPLSLSRLVFGSRPVRATAQARWHPGEVDTTLTGTVEFAGGGLAQIACSLEVAATRLAVIAGSAGVVETDFRNHTDVGDAPLLRIRRGAAGTQPFEALKVERANGFLREAEAFAHLVEMRDRTAFEATRAVTLDVLAAMDALLESVRCGAPVAIPRAEILFPRAAGGRAVKPHRARPAARTGS